MALMYAPTKPSGYLRSSENTKDGDVQAAAAVKRIVQLEAEDPRGFDWEDEIREREYLSYGMGSGSAASVLVTTGTIHDESRYDVEGLIFP